MSLLKLYNAEIADVFSKTGWGTVETEDVETCEGFIQTLNFLSIAQTASFRGQEFGVVCTVCNSLFGTVHVLFSLEIGTSPTTLGA